MRLLAALAIALSMFVAAAAADETCISEASDGARVGEPIEARIARLETALRLSRAELAVNRRRR